jgi:ribosomal protein L11
VFPLPIAVTKDSNPETAPPRSNVPVPVVVEVSFTLSFTTKAILTPF